MQRKCIRRLCDVVVEVAIEVCNAHDLVGLPQQFGRRRLELVRLVREHNARQPRRAQHKTLRGVLPSHLGCDDDALAKVRQVPLLIPYAAVAVELVDNQRRVGLWVLAPFRFGCVDGEAPAVGRTRVRRLERVRLIDALGVGVFNEGVCAALADGVGLCQKGDVVNRVQDGVPVGSSS